MTGITFSNTFLFMWIGFTLLMIVTIGLIFLWGIRTRQFTNQDRARYLPLDEVPPMDEEKPTGTGGGAQ